MLDAEISADPRTDGVQKVIGQCRIISIDEYMTGHHNQARLHRPDMEVVDVLDTGNGFDRGCHVRGADTWRGRFQQDVQRFLKQRPGPFCNGHDDQQADQRIEKGPSGE